MRINNVLQMMLVLILFHYSLAINQRCLKGMHFALSLMQANFQEQQSISIHSPFDDSYITFTNTRLLKTKINENTLTSLNNTFIEIKNISFLFIVDLFTYLPLINNNDEQVSLSSPSFFIELRYENITILNNKNLSLNIQTMPNSTLFFSKRNQIVSLKYFDYVFKNQTSLQFMHNKYSKIAFYKFSYWFNHYNLIYNDLVEIFKLTEKYFTELEVQIPLIGADIILIKANKHDYIIDNSTYIKENNTLVIMNTLNIMFCVLTDQYLEITFIYRVHLSEFNDKGFNLHNESIYFPESFDITQEECKEFFYETYLKNFTKIYSKYFDSVNQ